MISGSFHCARTVAVLSDNRSGSGLLIKPLGWSSGDAVQRQQRTHATSREIRIAQQARSVGEPEEFREMNDAARALLPADHREVRLMAIQPSEEHDTGFIKARWRRKNVTRQRYRRRKYAVERRTIAVSERSQSRRCRRCDCVENPEERIRVSARIAADQCREVEIVACVHANLRRKPT